jgi:ABC-type phosphate/phosphonate transport system substrate-binding protein
MILLVPSSGVLARNASLGSFLNASLRMWLGEEVSMEAANDYDEMTARIRAGGVAMAWAPPVVCARVEQSAKAILKSVRDGRSSYRAALIVRRGTFTSLRELAGLRASWVDPLSSGGYLLAAKYLAATAPEAALGEERFAGTYRAALMDVVADRADVTSIYVHSLDLSDALRVAGDIVGPRAQHLSVLGFTPSTPNDGLVLTDAMEAEQRQRLVQRITEAPSDVLLRALQVERLEVAEPGDYQALR